MLRSSVLGLGFWIVSAFGVAAESPLENRIADPVFLKDISIYQSLESDGRIILGLRIDDERCRAFYGDDYYSNCVPRLGMDGKLANSGVSLSPATEGEWRWQGDYLLTFTPSDYWSAGRTYSFGVDLDRLRVPQRVQFPEGARTATLQKRAEPLMIDIDDMRYMQDPSDPKRKLVSARLSTNYPIVEDTLTNNIALSLQEAKEGALQPVETSLSYDIQFGADGMSANLSVPIGELPKSDRYLQLSIAPGVAPAHGGDPTQKSFQQRARVPSLETYLAFQDASAVIVRTDQGAPEQILSLSSNVKAKPDEVWAKTKAYLLPAEHPVMNRAQKQGLEEPYQWQAANEVTPSILEKAHKVALAEMPSGQAETSEFGFGLKAPPGRFLYVSVEKGLEAFGGYTLDKNFQAIVQVPDVPHDVAIMQDGSILTLSGTKKLSLHARGTDGLKVEVAQVLPEALQYFVSQTRGAITDPSFKDYRFGDDDIAQLDEKTIPLSYAGPYASQYASFDFEPYLENNRKGIFILNIQGMRNGKPVGDATRRFVLVTDLGVLVKENADKSRDVFLISFQEGRPVSSAQVSVLGRNGLPVFIGKTESGGRVSLPSFEGYDKAREPVVIVAQKGKDFAFIPYARRDRALNLSRFDVGGSQIAGDGLNAFLFSDRGVYRPGETVHLGFLVKNADWQPLYDGLPLKIAVTDPLGRTVLEKRLSFSTPGLEEAALETEDVWPTGSYRVGLYISDDGGEGDLLGSTSVQVEEFVPDQLKINVTLGEEGQEGASERGWYKPEDLSARVRLANLYGTAASDRRVDGQVTLNPAKISFDAFADYVFFDPYAADPRTVRYDLASTRTDDSGHATVPLQLGRQEAATYSLNLRTTGFEAGSGRGISAYSSALISPMNFVIGYRTEENLGYLKKGSDANAEILALNEDLSSVEVDDLSLVLLRKTYVSSLIKRDDGSYVYEAVPKESEIHRRDFALSQGGQPLSLPTDEIGDFIFRLQMKEGRTVGEVAFSVAGEGQQAAGLDKETVLKLKTDKSDYRAGEEIELAITAPYTGAGLITLESDHVLNYKWFSTKTNETIQTIEIPEDFAGKGYVNVAFVRDINSREIFLSPLSNAVVPFTAGTENRLLKIALDVPENARPGEPLQISYRGNRPGKAVIFAVDEGILQVANYETPDPEDYFLLDRALQVETLQMLDLLMPEYELIRELSADGGGADAKAANMASQLNPFKREILAPAVYWSGIVDVGTDPKTLDFVPPGHFNGRMRVMAVATGDGTVGSAQEDVTVRAPIVVTPNTPLFLAPGDVAQGSVTIANGKKGSGKDARISLNVKANGGLEVLEAPDTVTVSEGREKSVTFTLRATGDLGPASVSVAAGLGDLRQRAEATLSIRPASPKESWMKAGYAEKGPVSVALSQDLYPDRAEREISVSALPTAYIFGLVRFLDGVPYGCSEQIASQALAKLSLLNFPEFSEDEAETKRQIAETVSLLSQRQTQEGGFSVWSGGYQEDDFISVYVIDFLLQAYATNIPVQDDIVTKGLGYLRDFANRDIYSLDDARNKAYAIYLLTRSGVVTSNEILHWLSYFEKKKSNVWRHDLSAVYLAGAYKMMQQNDLAAETMDAFAKGIAASGLSGKDRDANNAFYNPFIEYAQYMSILARHFPNRFSGLDQAIVFKLADFITSNRYNSLSASYAIQALRDYAVQKQNALADTNLTVMAEGKKLDLEGQSVLKTTVPRDARTIEISGGERFFYSLTETGFRKGENTKAVSEGLQVKRRFETPDGSPLAGPVAIGDEIDVVISLRALGEAPVENVAVIDLLPGGFALEPGGEEEGSTLVPEFVARREDRLIVFADAMSEEQTFRYRMRAVSSGKFQVPAPYAEAMYDLSKRARGASATIAVHDEKP